MSSRLYRSVDRLEQGLHLPIERQRDMVVLDLRRSRTPGSGPKTAASTGSSKKRFDRADRLGAEIGDAFDRDELAVADDADPVGDSLHLGQGVAGEEDGAALGGDLAHHRLELSLHQRIETGARLVHDQHVGLVHERLDQPDLLPVPRRQVADLLGEIGVEPFGERVDEVPVDAAAQVGEVGERVLAGEVRDTSPDRPGRIRCGCGSRPICRWVSIPTIEARPEVGGSRRGWCGSSWSCRHRLGRGSRRSRPRYVEVEIDEGREVAVVLGEPLGVDGNLVGHVGSLLSLAGSGCEGVGKASFTWGAKAKIRRCY